MAVALFEAIVEGAFLVATADGVFDATERQVFESVVVAGCVGAVGSGEVAALVSDLGDQLEEDGLACRIEAVGRQVWRHEHAHEVLRIAALLAMSSDGLSGVERAVLAQLAAAMKLDGAAVQQVIADVTDALAAASVTD